MNKGAHLIVAVLGILVGLGGVLVGGLLVLVYFVWRDYEPVYLPQGMTPPAERAEEFFVAALVALSVVAQLAALPVLAALVHFTAAPRGPLPDTHGPEIP